MRVLGLGTEGDSGAAIVENGRILAAVNEERLCRMKLVEGFPHGAITEVLRLTSTSISDLDAVLIGGTMEPFAPDLRPFQGWFKNWEDARTLGTRVKRAAGRFSRYRDRLPFLETGYYTLMAPTFLRRRIGLRRILQRAYGVRAPIVFVDHHFAHIASAYFTSGFDEALVISMDGGGDGNSSLVYAVRDGRFEYLHRTSAYNSLGNYYSYITQLCGFTAHKHEGKLTGLAAYGEPKYVPLLRSFIDEADGRISNRGGVVFMHAVQELDRRLPRGWTREDLAASVQQHVEDVARRYVQHWAHRSGLRDIALAGGVFANVRVNQEVHRLPEIGRIFIHPHMGDGGLSAGAALTACVAGTLERTMPHDAEPLRDVYLGAPLEEAQIEAALRSHGLPPEPLKSSIEEMVAELLMQGHVIARAAGRMEYGPRALGNRSILYHPTDQSVNDWLNQNLRRTEFMPFAPSVLYEAREQCFEQTAGAEHAAEFMTITFDATRWTYHRMEGVVHLDGTARPQFVRRDRNESYHRIIETFHQKTGLPAIINTSFNMHEEPIVNSADDCVRAFLAGHLDYLAIGPFLVKHPRGITRTLHPARRADTVAGVRVGIAAPRPPATRPRPAPTPLRRPRAPQ